MLLFCYRVVLVPLPGRREIHRGTTNQDLACFGVSLFQRFLSEIGLRPHNSATKLKRGKPFFRQMWPALHNDKTILNHCLRNSPLLNFVSRVNNLSAAKAGLVNKIIWAKSDEKTMH